MAVRTAYAGTASAGDVYTAANHAKMPGGWIGYAEVTANQNGITSITDLTSLSVAVTVGSSRRIGITGWCLASNGASGTGDSGSLSIRESSTTLARTQIYYGAASIVATHVARVVLTPSSGAHTYKLSFERAAGTGDDFDIEASSTYPAFILVEDLGPSS